VVRRGGCSGVKRQPLKKLQADEEALLKLLYRWRTEAGQTGREIKRVVVVYEAGRDGFWLARWLNASMPSMAHAFCKSAISASVSNRHYAESLHVFNVARDWPCRRPRSAIDRAGEVRQITGHATRLIEAKNNHQGGGSHEQSWNSGSRFVGRGGGRRVDGWGGRAR
jgi:hypothetical protein